MRKLLLTLLLAGAAATPALAGPGDDQDRADRGDRAERQAERQAERADRQAARAERQEMRSERPSFGGFDRAQRPQRDVQTVQQVTQPDLSRIEQVRDGRADGDAERAGGARNWRMQRSQVNMGRPEGLERGDFRQSDRGLPGIMQPRTRTPMVSDSPREGTQPPMRTERHFRSQPQWSTAWRHDRRYDWRDWRRRHHSLFNLSFYYDPFGWNYRPYSIGYRLWPSYYGSNYWLNDPWQYRLPYAPAGTRWIRYYNDAILVDMWSGQVVDVIYNVFW